MNVNQPAAISITFVFEYYRTGQKLVTHTNYGLSCLVYPDKSSYLRYRWANQNVVVYNSDTVRVGYPPKPVNIPIIIRNNDI